MGISGGTIVKYVDVVLGGNSLTMMVRILGGQQSRVEESIFYFFKLINFFFLATRIEAILSKVFPMTIECVTKHLQRDGWTWIFLHNGLLRTVLMK